MVNNSMRVGKPLGLMLENLGATVVKCYDKTPRTLLEECVRRAPVGAAWCGALGEPLRAAIRSWIAAILGRTAGVNGWPAKPASTLITTTWPTSS